MVDHGKAKAVGVPEHELASAMGLGSSPQQHEEADLTEAKNQLEPWQRRVGGDGQRRWLGMHVDMRFVAWRSEAGVGNECGEARGSSQSYL
jgi:hypothetical protein